MPRPSRALRTRASWTRTGGRDITLNSPEGWLTDPAIAQPNRGGWQNPGFHWIGSDTLPLEATPGEKLAAVSRATSLIVGPITGVPWQVFRGRERVTTPAWIRDPQNAQGDGRTSSYRNPLAMPAVAFWGQAVTSMLWHGEAFIYTPNLDPGGYPLQPLFLLHPTDVDTAPDGRGFTVDGEPIDPRHLIHLRDSPPYDNQGRGIGVLRKHAMQLQLASAVDTYAAGTFRSGVPAGYLRATNPNLTAEKARELRESWLKAHGGDTRSIAVLNATTEFHPISLSPVDAELVRMQDFTLREIAHAFNMSAHYLDVQGTSNTYANVRDRALDFRQLTLLYQARLIESTLDARLPYGTELKLRLDGLERGTTGQRYDDYTKAVAGGWLTLDEIRELEDMPPLPELPPTPEPVPPIDTDPQEGPTND